MGNVRERKNIRLKNFDYSTSGAYFVTICTDCRKKILSSIITPKKSIKGEINVNEICRGDPCGRPYIEKSSLGIIAEETLDYIETNYPCIIDEYIIMPDHIHLILFLNVERVTARVTPTKEDDPSRVYLGRIIGAYKSVVADKWRKMCNSNELIAGHICQRGYYDRVIRSRDELNDLRKYIRDNPARKYYDSLSEQEKQTLYNFSDILNGT